MWQSFVLVGILVIGYFIIKAKFSGGGKKNVSRQERLAEEERQLTDEQREILQQAEALAARQARKERAETEARNAEKLSAKDGLGSMILTCFQEKLDKDLLDLLDLTAKTENRWQAMFLLWLMRYIGMGVEPDPIENKDVLDSLDGGMFRKAFDTAPEESQRLLSTFKSYVGSGINCTSMHANDSKAQIRMRGLFHAVASMDFVDGSALPDTVVKLASGTLLYNSFKDEAVFWMMLFSRFPGVGDKDPQKIVITKYFAAFAQEEYAEKVRQECLDAMERSTGSEPEQPGDDLRLFMVNIGKNPARTNDPCVDLLAGRSEAEKMLPMVNGAFMGNAACMYSMAIMTYSPVMRQALDAFLHEHYQQDLSWGLDHLKNLLDTQKAKGDPAAEVMIGNIRAGD